MAGWCFLFSYVLIKWQFICWNRSYCILSMLQGWTEISSLKYSELFSESRNKEMLSIGLYLYIQVFTVSIKSDFIFLQFSIFSILFCVCVCVFGFEALFSESTYSRFRSSQCLPRCSPQQLLNVHKLLFALPKLNCVNKWLSCPCLFLSISIHVLVVHLLTFLTAESLIKICSICGGFFFSSPPTMW